LHPVLWKHSHHVAADDENILNFVCRFCCCCDFVVMTAYQLWAVAVAVMIASVDIQTYPFVELDSCPLILFVPGS
jgi:hypothetical protein